MVTALYKNGRGLGVEGDQEALGDPADDGSIFEGEIDLGPAILGLEKGSFESSIEFDVRFSIAAGGFHDGDVGLRRDDHGHQRTRGKGNGGRCGCSGRTEDMSGGGFGGQEVGRAQIQHGEGKDG